VKVRRALSKSTRALVLAKTNGRCAYCGEPLQKFCIDHIKAVHYGGTNETSNLLATCFSCNNFKMTFTLEQFRHEMQRQLERANRYSRNYRMAKKFGQIVETEKPIIFYFESIKPLTGEGEKGV
jgi:5-methylcytosine-specific restriction endonuclease McrA